MNPPRLFCIKKTAEAGGFEPPVRLPVRQFSKLLVSATHPNFHTIKVLTGALFLNCECKGSIYFLYRQTFPALFSSKMSFFYARSYLSALFYALFHEFIVVSRGRNMQFGMKPTDKIGKQEVGTERDLFEIWV